jgi:hypothetical protein
MSAIIAAIVRHGMALLGAVWAGSDAEIGATVRGLIEQMAAGDTNAIGGTLVTLAAIAWSIYDKRRKQIEKESNQ